MQRPGRVSASYQHLEGRSFQLFILGLADLIFRIYTVAGSKHQL
jgi:hypothetical protein